MSLVTQPKTVRLKVSYDDGTLYEFDQVEESQGYWTIEVPSAFGLTPSMICGCDGSIAEMLIRTGIGRKVES